VKQEDSDDAEPFWHHAQPISDISFDPAVDPADNRMNPFSLLFLFLEERRADFKSFG